MRGTKFPVRRRHDVIGCHDKWQLSCIYYLERSGNLVEYERKHNETQGTWSSCKNLFKSAQRCF
jgi:hypothetical protein